MANNRINSNGEAALPPSASFKWRKKAGPISRTGSDADEIINLLHGSDPVRVELNRLENEVRGSSLSLSLFGRKNFRNFGEKIGQHE